MLKPQEEMRQLQQLQHQLVTLQMLSQSIVMPILLRQLLNYQLNGQDLDLKQFKSKATTPSNILI